VCILQGRTPAPAPAAFLREAARLLKPGGEVVLVDWQKRDGPPGPPAEHRLSVEEVLAYARDAGLRAAGHRDLNEHHYLVALRPSGGTG
jgi:ubiquinone/menaquinone biosynthesis C-methylase UbiE